MLSRRTSKLKHAISQVATIGIVVVIIVIIAAGGLYVALSSSKTSTVTSVSTSISTSVSTSISTSVSTVSSTHSTTPAINLTAAAQKEGGTITIYGDLDAATWDSAIQPALQQAYPFLKISYNSLGTGALASKAISEYIAGKVSSDLLFNSLPQQISAEEIGALQQWNNTAFEYAQGFSANNTDPAGYWHPGFVLPSIIIYNTNMVTAANAPKSYSDFTNSKWSGQFVMQDPSLLGGMGTLFGTLYPIMGNASWTSLMQGISANKPVILSSNGEAFTDVQSGQYPVGFGQLNDFITEQTSGGGPVAAEFPTPLVGAPVVTTITKGAAHPMAAELVAEWFTTAAGQNALYASGRPPMNPTIFAQDMAKYIPAGTQLLPGGVNNPTFNTDPSYWSAAFVKIFGP